MNLEITDDDFNFEELKKATYTVCVYTDFELPEENEVANTDEELEIDEDDMENANNEISTILADLSPFASETFYLNDSTITYIFDSNLIELALGD